MLHMFFLAPIVASAVESAVAFNDALNQLRDALGSSKPTILRADWVTDVEEVKNHGQITLVVASSIILNAQKFQRRF